MVALGLPKAKLGELCWQAHCKERAKSLQLLRTPDSVSFFSAKALMSQHLASFLQTAQKCIKQKANVLQNIVLWEQLLVKVFIPECFIS